MTDEPSAEDPILAAQFEIQTSFCDGTILHRKHMSKILSTPTHCCWSVLLLQVQTWQLRHPLERDGCSGNILPVSHHKEGRQTGAVQRNRVTLRCSHRVRRISTTPTCFFPSLPAVSACSRGKSADKWSICSLAYQWQSCPCCLLNTSLPTAHSLLLPGGEQISRNKVTAACTLCMCHLTQSTNTAWEKWHWQVQQRLWSLP